MERLVAEITRRGLSVSTVKHAHHAFDVDQEGRDSFRHRAAGAHEVLLASHRRVALMQELRGAPEPALADLLARLSPVDLVLVEGYKREAHAKIEAHRAETGAPLIATSDASVRAVASDEPETAEKPPQLRTVASARPPRIRPKRRSAPAKSPWAMPERASTLPMKMKSGTTESE